MDLIELIDEWEAFYEELPTEHQWAWWNPETDEAEQTRALLCDWIPIQAAADLVEGMDAIWKQVKKWQTEGALITVCGVSGDYIFLNLSHGEYGEGKDIVVSVPAAAVSIKEGRPWPLPTGSLS